MSTMHSMSDNERYFFDVNGYLVLRNVLDTAELAELNQSIDHNSDQIDPQSDYLRESPVLCGSHGLSYLYGMLRWPAPWGTPFRSLLIHPAVVSRLNELCGRGFRLDSEPFMIEMTDGSSGDEFHGGGDPFPVSNAYAQRDGQMLTRGVNAAWQLEDVHPGNGGLAIVPGSHKARYPRPQEITTAEDAMGMIVQPATRAGDVILFAASVTHGTLRWSGHGPRRTLLYKYSARTVARQGGPLFTPERFRGSWTEDLSPEQQAVLYGPGLYWDEPDGGRVHAPSLTSAGSRTDVVGR